MERINAWTKYEDRTPVLDFSERYRRFISSCKTERECVKQVIDDARAAGYRDLDDVIAQGDSLKAGDKVYSAIMGKSIALFHLRG